MMHLSRFSEELILWSSREFSFIEISDGFTTGSSIMPQKKNPDIPELVRGKTGRVYGALVSLLTLMKSLPLAYNRDMQEDKPQLFDAVDTLKASLDIYIRMLPEITVKTEGMEKSTEEGFINATDMADYLAEKGMPFREAHSVTGKAVGYALARNKELQDLSLEEMRTFSTLILEDIFAFLKTERVINRRKSKGGTASENVKKEIAAARDQITTDKKAAISI
jgi:argininosuccinate lyase